MTRKMCVQASSRMQICNDVFAGLDKPSTPVIILHTLLHALLKSCCVMSDGTWPQ